MNYRNLGVILGLAIIAGILVWQGVLITRAAPKSLIPPPKAVTGGAQQPAGDVSVEINYLAGKSGENKIVFEISLNTHSVDLDGIDFSETVVMQKDGQTLLPLAVEASGSGHHRSAELSFSRAGVPLKIVFLGTPEVGRQEFEFGEL